MSNKHSKSTLRSRVSGFEKPSKIIVFVEGRNTERTYVDWLKQSNLKVMPIVRPGHGIGSCVQFVNDSIKAFNTLSKTKRNEYCQKWLMFDNDGHKDFAESIKLAREEGFQVAFSSMCIEYWFILHFQEHDGSSIPCKADSHSLAQIEILNKHIEKYNKTLPQKQPKVKLYVDGSKNVEEDLFELMMANDPVTHKARVLNACKRASDIHHVKKVNGAEFSESVTTMYQFLITIGFVKVNSDGVFSLSM